MFETDLASHPTFWTSPAAKKRSHTFQPAFLAWRLRRLNRTYREAVNALWLEHGNLLAPFLPFVRDFPPRAGEPFAEWERRQGELTVEYSEVLSGVLSQAATGTKDASWAWSILGVAPIPFDVRFPLIDVAHYGVIVAKDMRFLVKYGAADATTLMRRGRTPDWRLYLLAYEMHLSGVRDIEIARVLMGAKGKPLDKAKELVRLAKIKKVMKPLVDGAFTPPRLTLPSRTYPIKN